MPPNAPECKQCTSEKFGVAYNSDTFCLLYITKGNQDKLKQTK